MGSKNSNCFGFELLKKLIEDDLKKKEDVLVAFCHWVLLFNGFKCIGLGDSKKVESNEKTSELLPKGWNDKDHFALRYLKDDKLYILIARKSDENLLFNLLRVDENNVSNVKYNVETTVKNINGDLTSMIPNHGEVMTKMVEELIEPVDVIILKTSSTQTSAQEEAPAAARAPEADPPAPIIRLVEPLRVGQPRFPNWLDDPLNVGRADLDPLVGIGIRGPGRDGGMLLDPFHRGIRGQRGDPFRPEGIGPRLPPGAIPPGARFDPYGPPDLVRPPLPPRNPDHDHMPPPGYDDMFM